MKEKKQRSFSRYVKWAIAFMVGTASDFLRSTLYSRLATVVLTCAIAVMMIFCFDVYEHDIRNLPKMAYIIICSVTGTYYSIESIFLVTFELLTK